MVDVDAGLHDAAHVVDVAALARGDDRDAAVPVADREVRPRGQEHVDHRDAAGDAGDQPRGVVAVVEGVRVGAEGDQDPGRLDPVVRRREEQRGALVVVALLEVGAAAQGEGDLVGVAVETPALAGGGLGQEVGDLVEAAVAGGLLRGPAVPARGMLTSTPAATRTRTVST